MKVKKVSEETPRLTVTGGVSDSDGYRIFVKPYKTFPLSEW